MEAAGAESVVSPGRGRLALADFAVEPGARHGPVAYHRPALDLQKFRDFLLAETSEILQFDHLGGARVHLREAVERGVERHQLFVAFGRGDIDFVEAYRAAVV